MKRIYSIDFFRVLAIIFVIALHTYPFDKNPSINYSGNYVLFTIIRQLSRFAVPFFFIISGYFYGIKIKNNNSINTTTINMAKRIFIILVAWSIVYLFPFDKISSFKDYGLLAPIKFTYWRVKVLLDSPIKLLFQSTMVHLWFLISLLLSILATGLFLKFKLNKLLVCIAILTYVFGNLAKAYVNTPIGIDINFNTRNGLFFSLIFFVSGYYISIYNSKNNLLKKGILLFLAGLILQFFELYFLNKFYNASLNQDYVFATYLIGIGASLISLSNHKYFSFSFASKIGKKTLGVYGIHFMFIFLLKPVIIRTYHPLLEISFPIIIYLVSLGTTRLLSINANLRRIVE